MTRRLSSVGRVGVATLLLLAGCRWPETPYGRKLKLGERCTPDEVCRELLACVDGACATTGELPIGDPCTLSGDCQPGLYCAAGICDTAGAGGNGALCLSTADCQQGLYCAFEGFGSTCRPPGRTDIEEACQTAADCAAALVCDPSTAACQIAISAPAGETCERDADCDPGVGIICLRPDNICGGAGPDGKPVIPWAGNAACELSNELQGDFTVLFDVAGSKAGNGFYRLPFPNDARLVNCGTDGDGNRVGCNIDMSGHPEPPAYAVPTDLIARYLDAIEAREVDGFGPNQTVFLRFSGPPKFCAHDCGTAGTCEEGCMGPGEPDPILYVADLTKDDAGAFPRSPFNGVSYRWVASTGNNKYICWNWLAAIPSTAAPWRSGHTYLAYIHTRAQGAGNEAIRQAPDFSAMLGATDPANHLTGAWQAYAPLREWLATSPPLYPACRDLCTDITDCTGDDQCIVGICGDNRCANECEAPEVCAGDTCERPCTGDGDCTGGATCLSNFCVRDAFCDTCAADAICTGSMDTVTGDQIAGATLFTIRDPTRPFGDLANAVAAQPAPIYSGLVACTDTTAGQDCSDGSNAGQTFVEVQGDVLLPIFQGGKAPYETTGGAIALDAATGEPDRQSQDWVPFSLSLPKRPTPPAGWPVMIYAHGAGGDHRSHIRVGIAELMASHSSSSVTGSADDTGFAVLGIDQVAHGTRAGTSAMQPDFLFSNFDNPGAAVGNTLQGAADQLSLVRSVGNVSAALAGVDGLLAALGLDPVNDSVSLDATRVVFLGHSQGAGLGTLAMASDTTVPAVALSGAGANLIESLTSKTSPYDLKEIIQVVVGDRFDDGHAHPALSIIQGYLEEADSTNFIRLLSREPRAGGLAKHYLQVIGVDDTYTPGAITMIQARQAGVEFLDPDSSGLPRTAEITTPPVRSNRATLTRVATIHQPPADADGHFVLFDLTTVQDRVAEFFASWRTDPEGIPTVQ